MLHKGKLPDQWFTLTPPQLYAALGMEDEDTPDDTESYVAAFQRLKEKLGREPTIGETLAIVGKG